MSGVASIGSCAKLHTPSAASAAPSMSISQRCAIEKRMTRCSRDLSMLMSRPRLLDIRLDHVALLDDDFLAELDALEHFDTLGVAIAQAHGFRCVSLPGLYEDDCSSLERLKGAQR